MMRSTEKAKGLLKTAASFVFWIAVWYIAAFRVGQELVLPTPHSVLKTLGALCVTADFWEATSLSLFRIFGGFFLGLAAGTLIGAATEISAVFDVIFSPLIRVVRATPVASFIILALLWIGRASVPGFISMLMVTPVIWGAVTSAVRGTDGNLLEMAKAYSFGRVKTLRLIYIPSVFPSWRSAAVTSMGLAWKAGIAAEVLCLPKAAVGTNLYYSKIYLETPSLFAWTAVVIIMSFLLEILFVSLIKRTAGGRHDKV